MWGQWYTESILHVSYMKTARGSDTLGWYNAENTSILLPREKQEIIVSMPMLTVGYFEENPQYPQVIMADYEFQRHPYRGMQEPNL